MSGGTVRILIRKLAVELADIRMTVDMLYDALSREDFYRLRQLIEEAERIAHRNGG